MKNYTMFPVESQIGLEDWIIGSCESGDRLEVVQREGLTALVNPRALCAYLMDYGDEAVAAKPEQPEPGIFDIGVWKTRDGRKATVNSFTGNTTFQLMGRVEGTGNVMTWTKDGQYLHSGESDRDLVGPWKEPEKPEPPESLPPLFMGMGPHEAAMEAAREIRRRQELNRVLSDAGALADKPGAV